MGSLVNFVLVLMLVGAVCSLSHKTDKLKEDTTGAELWKRLRTALERIEGLEKKQHSGFSSGAGTGYSGYHTSYGSGSGYSGYITGYGSGSGYSGYNTGYGSGSGYSGYNTGYGSGSGYSGYNTGYGSGSGYSGFNTGYGSGSGYSGYYSGYGSGSGYNGYNTGYGSSSGYYTGSSSYQEHIAGQHAREEAVEFVLDLLRKLLNGQIHGQEHGDDDHCRDFKAELSYAGYLVTYQETDGQGETFWKMEQTLEHLANTINGCSDYGSGIAVEAIDALKSLAEKVYFDIDPSVGVAELEAAYNAEKAKAEAIAYSWDEHCQKLISALDCNMGDLHFRMMYFLGKK